MSLPLKESCGQKPATDPQNYVCINCGHPVDSLYKRLHSSSVLKIIECTNCLEVADKYIEYEPIVVTLDIVQLNREAYRHVLYNTNFRIRWKLAVVIVLFESYIWTKEKQQSDPYNAYQLSPEQLFYLCFALCVFDKFILSVLLYALGQATSTKPSPPHPVHQCRRRLQCFAKGVTLASVTKFFLLPAVIWHGNTTEEAGRLHELLIGLYYLMALVQIQSVLINRSRWQATAIVAIAMAVKTLLQNELHVGVDKWLWQTVVVTDSS